MKRAAHESKPWSNSWETNEDECSVYSFFFLVRNNNNATFVYSPPLTAWMIQCVGPKNNAQNMNHVYTKCQNNITRLQGHDNRPDLLAVTAIESMREKLAGSAKVPSPSRNKVFGSAWFVSTGSREEMRIEESKEEEIRHQQKKTHESHQVRS